MARSMWRGAVQFRLYTIPVKLPYLATEAKAGLSFNDAAQDAPQPRSRLKTYCPVDDEVHQRA